MERRQFNRILFSADAQLIDGQRYWQASLVDLSLKGALMKVVDAPLFDDTQSLTLKIILEGADHPIQMQGNITHQENTEDGTQAGFACRDIDIDSATELRRLMELNLADQGLLQRDLHALTE